MNKIKFERFDQLAGWLSFAIAAWTYLATVEPSVSFWDCPEYVSCAAKVEVEHPSGNTFFLLAGRFFANFAAGDMTQVAIWVNRMSALLSAGTILFLFLTITAYLLTGCGQYWQQSQCCPFLFLVVEVDFLNKRRFPFLST